MSTPVQSTSVEKTPLCESDILEIAGEIVQLLKNRTDSYRACVNILDAAKSAISGSDLIPTDDLGWRLRVS